MQHTIQHLYKTHGDDGLLYAWFLSMHTRVDIILCCQKSENELMLVVNSIYDTLRQLERIANYYDPSSELSQVNQMSFHSSCYDQSVSLQDDFIVHRIS